MSFRPRFSFVLPALLAGLSLFLSPAAARASGDDDDCKIDGPSSVRPGESFELCARGKRQWSFVWSGPNLSWKRGRCVEVSNLSAGTYEFRVEISKSNKWGKRHSRVCTHRVTVRGDAGGQVDCTISGPSTVVEGRSFELCGPKEEDDDDDGGGDGDRVSSGQSWLWSGPGVPNNSRSRCVTISGRTRGTYTYTLKRTRGSRSSTCTHTVTVVPGNGGALDCTITGPTTVVEGRSFTLCGPGGEGSYTWTGPGVPAGSTQQCVTVGGQLFGSYVYLLRRNRGGVEQVSCSHTVFVVREGGGLGDLCPGPIRFWLEQCRTNGTGPIGIGAQTLARVATCVDERSTAWNWSDDRNSFCALIESASLRPRDLLRQQLAILIANRCARDFDIRLPNGNRIGIDSTAGFTCSPVDTGRVDQLIARAESLLVRCADPRTSPATCGTELGALTLCLGVLNRGPDTCSVGNGLGTLALASEPLNVETARFTPNPFTTATRMSYALAESAPVDIGVYDLTGRRVAVLESGRRAAGVHELRWDGVDDDGARVRPGVYFVRGTLGERTLGVRVVYVK